MTRAEKGWLAGVIDGEGSICAFTHRAKHAHELQFTVRFAIANRHPRLIEKCRLLIEEGIGEPINYQVWTSKHIRATHGQPCYQIYASRFEQVAKILRLVLPHLVAKRDQAVLMLDYLTSRGTLGPYRRDENRRAEDLRFIRRMQSLNARYHYSPRRDYMEGVSEKDGDDEIVRAPRIHEGGEESGNAIPEERSS